MFQIIEQIKPHQKDFTKQTNNLVDTVIKLILIKILTDFERKKG